MMGGPPPGMGQPMGMQPMGMQPQPMQFPRTSMGEQPSQKLTMAKDQIDAQISDVTFAQAKLKHEKDQMQRKKSVYEQILDRIKGAV